jgi:hypothetical protein
MILWSDVFEMEVLLLSNISHKAIRKWEHIYIYLLLEKHLAGEINSLTRSQLYREISLCN